MTTETDTPSIADLQQQIERLNHDNPFTEFPDNLERIHDVLRFIHASLSEGEPLHYSGASEGLSWIFTWVMSAIERESERQQHDYMAKRKEERALDEDLGSRISHLSVPDLDDLIAMLVQAREIKAAA